LLANEKFRFPLALDLKYVSKTLAILLRHPSTIPKAFGGLQAIDEILQEAYLKHPITLKHTHGFDISLDPEDLGISPSIGVLGWYELRTTELFLQLLQKGFTVIDVGANVGFFTLLAAKLVEKEGTVLAFEPEPTSFSLLSGSVLRNNFSNVKLSQKCVSDIDGRRTLYLSSTKHRGMHSIIRDSGGTSVTVPSTRLDTEVSRLGIGHVDLLKIDVEGAEPEVLGGAQKLLSEGRIRNMIIEWEHPEIWSRHEELVRYLLSTFDAYELARSLPFVPMRRLKENASTRSLFQNRFGTNLYLRSRN